MGLARGQGLGLGLGLGVGVGTGVRLGLGVGFALTPALRGGALTDERASQCERGRQHCAGEARARSYQQPAQQRGAAANAVEQEAAEELA